MAPSGSLTLSGNIQGLQWGTKQIGPLSTVASSSEVNAAAVTTIVLANGDNTITVPSSACVGVVIIFASASTTVKKIKGAAGDTGVTVTKNSWRLEQFDAAGAPANFIINSSAADTGNVTEFNWF